MNIPENPDPIDLFRQWLEEAKSCEQIIDAHAMTLATVDADATPWTRILLLKGVSEEGFTFYTNLASIKAGHLRANPRASLCFHWAPLEMQVRIIGEAHEVSAGEADAYFATRPRESQIGAWASRQSATLAARQDLEARVFRYVAEFADKEVPRPAFWSGYRLRPDLIEFWRGSPFRLHHRRAYTRREDGTWASELLYP